MKVFSVIIFSCVALDAIAWAQIPPNYTANLTSTQAIPPNPTRLQGNPQFTLYPNGFFYGYSIIDFGTVGDSVQLFRSTSPGDLGTPLYSWTSVGAVAPDATSNPGWMFEVIRTLTPAEIADLNAGYWWMNVSSSAYPGESIRGQIVAVPEPSTYALMAFGVLGFFALARRER